MATKIQIGLVFGGRSGEHEISIKSASSVIEALSKSRFEVVPIAIAKSGKWLAPAESAGMLPDRIQKLLSSKVVESDQIDVAIIGDPSQKGLVSLNSENRSHRSQPLDIIFPVLHGTFGEDGTIQGLFEMAGVPYVGCGVLASSCGMDKVTMKSLFEQANLPICNYTWFLREEWEANPGAVELRVKRRIGFPMFLKPANLGSSVGVSEAKDKKSLRRSIELAARYDRKVVVEEKVDAREIECGVLGNDAAKASLPGEYVVKTDGSLFLDYNEKYSSTGHVEFVVPAPIPKMIRDKVQKMAVAAFKAIDGSGLARVDFFLRHGTHELLVNEINTMPGLTEISGYPKMWEASGMPFPRVLENLVELALERHREKARNETSI